MYLRISRRSSSLSNCVVLLLTAPVIALASATAALSQSAAPAASELPPLEVETSAKKKVAKRKPTSEPQAPVTQSTGAAADPEAPVVFSANRTPTDYAKVGSTVSVITEKDIDAQSKTFLQDYLQQVPGVSVTTVGGFGQPTTFRLRGLNQNYVKVLVDGMDMSDPSGAQTATAFEHLLVGDVAQVEVLKGSQSTLFGGDALAGVISIDTKYATKPGFFQSGAAEYGTYDTSRGAYSAGYASADGSNVAFTVQGIDTDGFSAGRLGTEDDAYRNGTVSGRGEVRVSDAVTVFFAGRAIEAHTEYDRFDGFDNFDNGDYAQQAGRVGTNISLFGGQFVNTFAIQAMEVQRDNFGSSHAWFDGERVKGEYRGVLSFNRQLALVVGTDWEQNGAISSGDPIHHQVDVVSPYAELIVEPIAGLTLTGGGRIDNHSTFGSFDTHRLTAAYVLPTETKFHASYGTGFRAPSLNELYGPFGGNTALNPETSKSWDAGIEQGFFNNRLGIGATYFSIDLTDRIEFVSVFGPCPPCGFYQQVPGVTKTDGVELTAFAKLTQRAIVNAAYTFTDSIDPDGTRTIRQPRHSYVVGLTAEPIDKLSVNVTGQYIADSLDNDFSVFPSEKKAVDDYFLLSAKVGYEVLPGTVAYVRGENLLDEDYVTSLNYNNPGLTVFGGVQFALPAN
jgi:vitamin B12 transporter